MRTMRKYLSLILIFTCILPIASGLKAEQPMRPEPRASGPLRLEDLFEMIRIPRRGAEDEISDGKTIAEFFAELKTRYETCSGTDRIDALAFSERLRKELKDDFELPDLPDYLEDICKELQGKEILGDGYSLSEVIAETAKNISDLNFDLSAEIESMKLTDFQDKLDEAIRSADEDIQLQNYDLSQ